jgi:DnaK suppressor protein
MPEKTVLASIRSQLEDERDKLREQVSSLGGGETKIDFDENFADSGQVAAEQGEAKVLAASLREQLNEVERALKKLDEGSYGKCEACDTEISEARLEAMPATRFCIEHAGR